MQRVFVCFRRCLPMAFSLVMGLAAAGMGGVAAAATLTSRDGKKRDFPVVVAAAEPGLTVRESAGGRDVLIPWERMDLAVSMEANEWLRAAHAKAVAGGVVALNLGLEEAAGAEAVAEWRTVRSVVEGGVGQGFGTLRLSAYVHREVEVPRMALVWVGGASPLARRGDAADMVRRLQGALVVADFEGLGAGLGEAGGRALVTGVAELLRRGRVDLAAESGEAGAGLGAAEGVGAMKDPVGQEPAAGLAQKKMEEDEAEPVSAAGPAILLMGRGEAAAAVWDVVCSGVGDILAAVTLDGNHRTAATPKAFVTPCLFIETPTGGSGGAPMTGADKTPISGSGVAEDVSRPRDLWRHFSTDGCRWCYAEPAGDPLTLAVSFVREVAEASPYVEVLELLEAWQGDRLRHRIPMPVRKPGDFREEGFRLASPDGMSVFPVASRSGAARNDLVWVPSEAFAARLAGK
jgi:hypothetical protein